jgi:peptidoglycan hydrolase-like protein with peptidoglycan-binding domain
MQMAPTADRIRDIQSALAKSGAFLGELTGKWDAESVEAMKRFQQLNGLTPSGKLTALSLQKLGLGSDIAGRGAPKPVMHPPASSTSTSSSSR